MDSKPRYLSYLLRADHILLLFSSACLVLLSATRTWGVIRDQAGPVVATLAVIGLEGSITGGLLAVVRHNQEGWLARFMRNAALYMAVLILLLVLIVTNTYSEIQALGVVVNPVLMNWVIVFFLGTFVPVLVVVNVESAATRIHQAVQAYQDALKDYYNRTSRQSSNGNGGINGNGNGNGARRYAMPRAKRLDVLRTLSDADLRDAFALAKRMGVRVTTIERDIREVLEERKGGDF
jgi:ABC-type multidrug transport system fused ATPase/permease subunit